MYNLQHCIIYSLPDICNMTGDFTYQMINSEFNCRSKTAKYVAVMVYDSPLGVQFICFRYRLDFSVNRFQIFTISNISVEILWKQNRNCYVMNEHRLTRKVAWNQGLPREITYARCIERYFPKHAVNVKKRKTQEKQSNYFRKV